MIISEETELGRNTVVKDHDGHIVGKVIWFDTETKKAELYAVVSLFSDKKENHLMTTKVYMDGVPGTSIKFNERKAPTFHCLLIGCHAYHRKTGKKIID